MWFIPDLDDCRFACLSHITGDMETENKVLYNPMLSKERNMCIIQNIVKKKFNVELTQEELMHITDYDRYQIKAFVYKLREYIEEHKKEK